MSDYEDRRNTILDIVRQAGENGITAAEIRRKLVEGRARSECCGAGVWIGSCSACGKSICRVNPRTGRQEWLDGASPWTTDDDLRPIEYAAQADS